MLSHAPSDDSFEKSLAHRAIRNRRDFSAAPTLLLRDRLAPASELQKDQEKRGYNGPHLERGERKPSFERSGHS